MKAVSATPTQSDYLSSQYATSAKLRIRAATHRLYTEPPAAFTNDLLQHLKLHAGLALLDVGCGNGWNGWLHRTLGDRGANGFFMEFDRGTVRPAPLRAKFAAYHRYFASARAARDFDGPPSILVVTAGPAAEDRVADAVLAAEFGQPRRLPLLLTTADLLVAAKRGPFDAIWRVPGSPGGRHSWPL